MPIGPDYGPSAAEQVTLVQGDAISLISVRVMRPTRAPSSGALLGRERALRGDAHTPARLKVRAAVDVRGDTLVVVGGSTPQATLTKVVKSAKPVEDAAWQAFRRRVLDLPVSALLLSTVAGTWW